MDHEEESALTILREVEDIAQSMTHFMPGGPEAKALLAKAEAKVDQLDTAAGTYPGAGHIRQKLRQLHRHLQSLATSGEERGKQLNWAMHEAAGLKMGTCFGRARDRSPNED